MLRERQVTGAAAPNESIQMGHHPFTQRRVAPMDTALRCRIPKRPAARLADSLRSVMKAANDASVSNQILVERQVKGQVKRRFLRPIRLERAGPGRSRPPSAAIMPLPRAYLTAQSGH